MLTLRKIVAAVDGSEVSLAAFDWALELAALFSAEIIVVTVSDRRTINGEDVYPAFLSDRKVKEFLEDYNEHDRGVFKDIKTRGQQRGVKVSTVVLYGLPSQEIVELAAEESADLIIMGSHGKKEEFYHEFSSTSERVLKKASCPVLMVVPPRTPPKQEKKTAKKGAYRPILYST
jgi:nucleotide-binding universal stress UspA family protein